VNVVVLAGVSMSSRSFRALKQTSAVKSIDTSGNSCFSHKLLNVVVSVGDL
jgi:hypothetical protein